jgi:hypothetical protein
MANDVFTTRWTPRRKAAVVLAIQNGTVTAEEVCKTCALSAEEQRGAEIMKRTECRDHSLLVCRPIAIRSHLARYLPPRRRSRRPRLSARLARSRALKLSTRSLRLG